MVLRKTFGMFVVSCLLAVASFALDLPANKLVSVDWLKENLGNKDLVIIDIRNDKKKEGLYKKGHIPGAIQWKESSIREVRFKEVPGYIASPIQFTRVMRNSGITDDSVVVFYSDGQTPGSYTIAGLAVYITEYYGFTNTAVLNGGFAAWQAAGYPVETDIVKPKRSNWKITKMNTDLVAALFDIDAATELGTAQLIDSRNNAQVEGSAKHPKVLKAGHIPGAKHIFVGNFTKKDGDVVYLDAANAKAQFEKAGVDMNKPAIWYCNTSWYASGAWFAGKYLGGLQNAKVYEGSMVEYTRAPKRKVVKGAIK
jgi:thiosulfate/3-mercaptopyruvate sulfurtransferase